ncbi:MAG TPA: SurA N-terminal domain-containing protein [Pseudomonadales bacterium]|nr:SurA N-terminal domain-containing protein [Pseudomonadales bacterium]
MLQKMREQSQSVATKVLLGLLIIVFTMFGFGAFEAFIKTDPPAAKINGVKISQAQLAMETDRQKQRILAQMGDNANPDLIDPNRLRKSVLDGLINQSILLQSAKDMGLRVSDAEVDRVIVENPQFQVNAKFDPDLYRRLIANAGHTPMSFRTELTNSYTVTQLTNAVRETPFVTDDEVRDVARLLTQRRDIAFLAFAPEKFEEGITIGDDDVNAYYQSHLPEFMTEDTVDVDYVQLSLQELAKDPAFAPTDDQVAARYEADSKAFKPTERRQVEHILLQVNDSRTEDAAIKELAAIKDRIAHGERFEDIARKVSEDPGSAKSGGDLGFVARGGLDPDFEKAAWALGVNEVSDPVRSSAGVHLIKVVAIRADQYPAIEKVRDQIVAELREQAADEKYRAKITELDQLAFETPDDLTHLAEVSQLPIKTATGITQSKGTAPFDVQSLRNAAFGDDVVGRGFNSRVIEVDKNAYVLRVKEHRPPVERALADVSATIRQKLVKEAAADRAREAAASALGRVAKGDPSALIAADAKIDWQVVPNATRGVTGVDREILKAAFDLARPGDTPSATSVDLANGTVAVVTVTAVKDGDYGVLTETDRASVRAQLERRVGSEEFAGLFITLRDSASIERM